MKKILLVALLALTSVAFVAAQPRAIGARLGWDPQFSYEHGLGNNMLSIEAGAFHNFHGVQAAVTYDWIDPFGADVPWNERGEWHWYLGVGAGAGVFFWDHAHAAGVRAGNDYFYVGVAGRVGIEYDFWFPLQLSLDYRPVFGPGFDHYYTNAEGVHDNHTDVYFHGAYGDPLSIWVGGIALSVRYKF